ncbi:MAG TPA: FlgD immunoglobulin-like domain containing protein [Candidatus Krumholzibacteria bacterium]|nr:FlgD immunoglobulin-like domain containing protein [Candidatus Krumholzibacteria bacterium]
MIRRLAAAALLLWAGSAAADPYAFTWDAGVQGATADLLALTVFHSDVVNTGENVGQYRVTMTVEAPAAWVTSMCEGDFCYAPFIRTFDFSLSPGAHNDIGANITAVTDPGRGLVSITVASLDDPGLSITHAFTVVTPGFDVLIVDADPAGDPVPLTAAALGLAGKSAVAWSADLVGAPDAASLAPFSAVIWSTGAAVTGLDAGARTALDAFATNGGLVWLNGSKLVFGQCFSGSPAYDSQGRAWMGLVAGVDWAAALPAPGSVAGVPGDELGDGLAVGLGGGDGADNSPSPDALLAVGGGFAALQYPGSQAAAVRRVWGAGRVVTMGFTFEAVSSAADRAALATAVFDWAATGVSAAPAPDAPGLAAHAAPNPFNPRTLITWIAPAEGAATEVTVHDLRGRRVRQLVLGRVAAGPQSCAWDGRDDAGRTLPGGLYLVRIRAGARATTLKLTLAK